MSDMDTMGFKEFKSFLSTDANLNDIKKFSEKYIEYFKYKNGFFGLRTEGLRSTPAIEVDKYLSDLLDIAEQRKGILQKIVSQRVDRQHKEKQMWANLDKIAVKTVSKKGCNDFNSCACELRKIALKLVDSLGAPGEEAASILLQQAMNPCSETGALRKSKSKSKSKSKKLTQRVKKAVKSLSKQKKKNKKKKNKRSSSNALKYF